MIRINKPRSRPPQILSPLPLPLSLPLPLPLTPLPLIPLLFPFFPLPFLPCVHTTNLDLLPLSLLILGLSLLLPPRHQLQLDKLLAISRTVPGYRFPTDGTVATRWVSFFFGAALAEFQGVGYAFVAEEVACSNNIKLVGV